LDAPTFSLPRHNSSAQLPSELPAELLSAPLVWVCRGGVIPPLQPLYDGPYAVLHRGLRSFTSCIKAFTVADPPSLTARVAAADCRAPAQAAPQQPSGFHFLTCWFLLLLFRRHLETVPELFSYPARRFLHTRDWRHLHGLYRSTRHVSGHCHGG
jgi:hypothetical protein